MEADAASTAVTVAQKKHNYTCNSSSLTSYMINNSNNHLKKRQRCSSVGVSPKQKRKRFNEVERGGLLEKGSRLLPLQLKFLRYPTTSGRWTMEMWRVLLTFQERWCCRWSEKAGSRKNHPGLRPATAPMIKFVLKMVPIYMYPFDPASAFYTSRAESEIPMQMCLGPYMDMHIHLHIHTSGQPTTIHPHAHT